VKHLTKIKEIIIMETIAELLKKITTPIPAKVQKKLNALDKLNEKLALAKTEHEELPTADSEEQLRNVTEYVQDETNELIEDLQAIVAVQEEKPPVTPAVEAPITEVVLPVTEEPIIVPPTTEPIVEKEKSGGMGWFAIAAGVVLLGVSAGFINTLRK
jgi:hypothetical protein